MLWYRSWLETRWRFLGGLVLLILSAAGIVFAHRQFAALVPTLPVGDPNTELGRRIQEAADVMRSYRGYIWSQWFRQNLSNTWTVFAVLLGTGGLLAQTSGGGALFTLSLPATRRQLAGIRAATGLVELFALALIPSLVVSLLSPAVGQYYGVVDVLIHSACFFVAGTVFFSLAFLLSTLWADLWRPLMIALSVAIVLGLCEQFSRAFERYGIFNVMNGAEYFHSGAVPWVGLLLSAALSTAMLAGALANLDRRDF